MRSLKSRLTLWLVVPALLISACDLAITYINTGDVAALVHQQLLQGAARAISEQLTQQDGSYDISVPPAAFELLANESHDRVHFSVRDSTGKLIAGRDDLPKFGRKLRPEQAVSYLASFEHEPVRVVAYGQAIPNAPVGVIAITQVAQTVRGYDTLHRQLFFMTMRDHVLLLLIMIVSLTLAFRWLLDPLTRFAERIAARAPGSLEPLDAHDTPSELQPVINSMNDYLQRLDATLTSYERFVANTAHQLRTSFAIVTSKLNYGLRNKEMHPEDKELLRSIHSTVTDATRTINQLLVLANIEQERHPRPERNSAQILPVANLLKRVLEEMAPLAQQRNLELAVDVLDVGISIEGSAYMLRELFSNLIDNAIRHHDKPQGQICLALYRQGERAVLRISDDGPGVPATEREKVFERFYRRDHTKPNSSGLGLAIVKEICEVLHAVITLDASHFETGLTVTVSLPLASTNRTT